MNSGERFPKTTNTARVNLSPEEQQALDEEALRELEELHQHDSFVERSWSYCDYIREQTKNHAIPEVFTYVTPEDILYFVLSRCKKY
jgi:hypothetical protein